MLRDPTFDLSTEPVSALAAEDMALRAQVEQFLYREARLLDTRAFDAWLDLWTPDGMYWLPHEPGQASPHDHISLFWEDATLREVRARRVSNARNWSQQPPTRTARLVGNVMLDGRDAQGRLVVHSTLVVHEWRLGQRTLAGLVTHKLDTGEGWKIYLKRVDLVNSTDAFANLEVFV
ncbi:aromatic-ring-hydroxylating dioxygenase subunit beta [Burkholderia gladioli]|uniref:aromatic-ring-hydroxylating dioxygenase subunit beta n=1 Tax=Burkholderia gladioli TaxID=28095 RepID=UPI00163F07CA|nr:aromatic-ring-hydroxylating dioxygenase subunit beta [Burkholderia gladioli]MDA0575948.1 aromatic-ring-hydroxylating dioxygenase subunit beta [Burkholderia gladioli]MDA0602747.1 aromatic-ring-hydroxylating dioxygenase subunit beta [Burkholderia gladioli]